MALAVLKLLVHQVHFIMVVSVYVIKTDVIHGNFLMVLIAFISLKNVQKVLIGIIQIVFLLIIIAQQGFMDILIIVSKFLKDVHLKLFGYLKKKYVNHKEIIALKELIYQDLLVNLIHHVSMEKNGK